MYFGTGDHLSWIECRQLDFQQHQLYIVQKFKYLGIMLDSRSRLAECSFYLADKICTNFEMLTRIGCYIGEKTTIYIIV